MFLDMSRGSAGRMSHTDSEGSLDVEEALQRMTIPKGQHAWEVPVLVFGPIALKRKFQLTVLKGQEHPFWSTVRLDPASDGVELSVTARAESQGDANAATLFFVGQMADVLSLHIGVLVHVAMLESRARRASPQTRLIVPEREWNDCFVLGRSHGQERATFSRALSWYRKGLLAEDAIDQVFALWLSMEIVGSKYAQNTERTRFGAKNRVLNCFDQLWGGSSQWKIIPNRVSWIDDLVETRARIAHGAVPVTVETAYRMAGWVPTLQKLASAFLTDWESKGQEIERAAVDGAKDATT